MLAALAVAAGLGVLPAHAQVPDSVATADSAGLPQAADSGTARLFDADSVRWEFAVDSAGIPIVPLEDSAGVPILFRGDTVGTVFGMVGAFTPQERASALANRLAGLREARANPDSLTMVARGEGVALLMGTTVVFAVTPEDAAGLGISMEDAAAEYAGMVRAALGQGLITRTVRQILIGAGLTLLTTLILVVLFRLLARWYPRLYQLVRDIQEDRMPSLRFQRLQVLSGEQIQGLVVKLAQASRVVISVILAVIYLNLVFSFFPRTRGLATTTVRLFLQPVRSFGAAFVDYLPNIFSIIVIIVITFYGLRALKVFFNALEHETISLRGFYPDWARTTFNIFRIMVIAFAVILIWPYLPASDSAAFQGVAAFLGLLVTFGSAGAVSNAVGGIVMVYMRPFQVGDRVRIADTLGDVVERGLLVTRVRTPKNVETTIPNSMVVGSHIVNYSAIAKGSGVILHTTVTIGYDVPWTEVHEALKEAARRSEGILDDPEPFVLQTALGDYAVSYELNAYTKMPKMMQLLYSRLHTNIQDTFAEAGIEILSPVYHALRDGNLSTIPGEHAPPESQAPAFRLIDVLRGKGPGTT